MNPPFFWMKSYLFLFCSKMGHKKPVKHSFILPMTLLYLPFEVMVSGYSPMAVRYFIRIMGRFRYGTAWGEVAERYGLNESNRRVMGEWLGNYW